METLHETDEIIGDRYQIMDVLGQGGMGTTYAALDLQTQQLVALKALSLRRMTDWKVLELFEREAKVLSYLQHPAIPRYLNYFQVDTPNNRDFYLVQELAEGRSLAALVQAGYRFDETEARKIAVQVLEILCYLHSLTPPVIHRDLKPQNLIRREDGQLFLVDFGAVQDTYRDTFTQGSTVVGTYGYMAPEQFRGKAYPATDLYGLAATLLFLLTHESPADLPQRRLKIDFRSRLQLSPAFADWLDSMLEPAVEDRFPSAREALAALKQSPKQAGKLVAQKPAGSRIVLQRTAQRLDMEVPPGNLFSSNLSILVFALAWNGFIFFWTTSAIAMGAPIFFPLFSIPFWIAGAGMLWGALSHVALRTRLHLDRQHFRLQQQVFGWQYRQLSGQTRNLTEIKLVDNGLKVNDQPVITCGLVEGALTHEFGSGLAPVEKEWLVQEISAFLDQLNK